VYLDKIHGYPQHLVDWYHKLNQFLKLEWWKKYAKMKSVSIKWKRFREEFSKLNSEWGKNVETHKQYL